MLNFKTILNVTLGVLFAMYVVGPIVGPMLSGITGALNPAS